MDTPMQIEGRLPVYADCLHIELCQQDLPAVFPGYSRAPLSFFCAENGLVKPACNGSITSSSSRPCFYLHRCVHDVSQYQSRSSRSCSRPFENGLFRFPEMCERRRRQRDTHKRDRTPADRIYMAIFRAKKRHKGLRGHTHPCRTISKTVCESR